MIIIRYWLVALLVFSGGSFAAGSNEIRIGGGSSAGEYIHIARSICEALGKLFSCQALETGGTLSNLRLLQSQGLEFGLAMANVADQWLKKPQVAARYTIVRRIGGESVLAFGKPEVIAAVGSWIGVRENAALMSIGLAGQFSGDASVLHKLREVPGSPLGDMEIKVYPDRSGLVAAVREGEVKLGFFVQIPNPDNRMFQAIEDADLTIMGVIDPDMITFDELYPIKSVTVKNSSWLGILGRAQRVETLNIPIVIIARRPETFKGRAVMVQKSAIKQIQEVPETGLLPQQSWMQEFTDSATLTLGSGLDQVLDTIESAAEGAGERIHDTQY